MVGLHRFFGFARVPCLEGFHHLLVLVDRGVDRHGEEGGVEDEIDLGAVEKLFDIAGQDGVVRGLGDDQVDGVVDAVVFVQVAVFKGSDLFLKVGLQFIKLGG